jgi:hypothetical protein
MLLADPFSRLCAPSEGYYKVSLPGKISTLMDNLPPQVAECKAARVSANKDTAVVARMVQQCRKPTNPISQGKLGSFVEPKLKQEADYEGQALNMDSAVQAVSASGKLNAFSIGTPHADTGVREIRESIRSGRAFAVLTSISLIPQIVKGINEGEMDEAVAEKVNQMMKLVMASTADAWFIHLPGSVRRHEIFTVEQMASDASSRC